MLPINGKLATLLINCEEVSANSPCS